jgi:TonB family protein
MTDWRRCALLLAAGLGLLAGRFLGQESQQNSPAEAPQRVPKVAYPERVRVSQGVAEGLLVKRVDPVYPPEAREQHIQGVVVLNVVIDREGNVSDAKLISGHPVLAPAAIEAVKQWKYKPYLLNGRPIAMETQVSVDFRLEPKIIRMIPAPIASERTTGDGIGTTMARNAADAQRVRVSQTVSQGLVVKRVYPRYPPEARKEHVQGTVVLMVLISREGDVSEVKLISGDPILAPAAIDAVKQWKYKPYLLDGRPVEVETTVQINFTLSGG